jgi:hypothetical protein
MNEFIKNKEIEAFKAILIQNENYGESPNTEGKKKTKKLPTPHETALKLAERYGNEWRYNDEQKTGQVYRDKHWEKASIGVFQSLVKTTIDARNIEYSTAAYIRKVVKLLQGSLMYPRSVDTFHIL